MKDSARNNIMWPDWEDRRKELLDKSEFFDFKNHSRTAEWLRLLAEKVGSPNPYDMLKKYVEETLLAWGADFVGNDELRKQRFEAVTTILLTSVTKLGNEMQIVLPIMQELSENLANLVPLGIAFAPYRRKGDRKMHFYEMCYHYALFVEGVFDESVRLLFLLATGVRGKSVSFDEVRKMSLWKLKELFQKLDLPDVFFQGWNSRIRNSIAHARFSYNDESGKMHFVDMDPQAKLPNYEDWYGLEDFRKLETQLSDLYTLVQDTIFMIRVQQLVLFAKVPDLGKYWLMPGIRELVSNGILKDPDC